ncbi:GTP pyrophosphokinase family protein [Paenibacillus doosanensis]|uniref:GTP pyrophosphokinase YwaC n=1 Tax=Paenibacillus konkukensis TaxID=2020716 RepID=A0ABY4S1P6_9BACL|nr:MULTISPECIES: GTP pyrophosphokinase family protein [Paenibacillus]MCS7463342.1 GTP pyrophosphokinase family protein [Paenibacillus doosanensis]UQZ87649.1 GTP pyrophosphokinase YwaC [Paenibacillus konkukensis]
MNTLQIEQFRKFKNEITRFMMAYKFALDAFETKIEILKEEFQFLHDYNPIEHTKSRLKSPESILNKLHKKGHEISLPSIREHIKDIAGIRITCSFISDIYRISEMLQNQSDLTILEVKDYIQHPKPNGYRSLHLLAAIPVFMSDRQENVCVEVQIRTIAMDFWASLEHKIYYKYDKAVPPRLLQELKEASDSASALDRKMERLHNEIAEVKEAQPLELAETMKRISINNQHYQIPEALLRLIGDDPENG